MKLDPPKNLLKTKNCLLLHFFITQYPKLRILELYINVTTRLSDVDEVEDLEMHAEPLYLALAQRVLSICILSELKTESEHLLSKNFIDSSTADKLGQPDFLPSHVSVVQNSESMTSENPVMSNKSSQKQRFYVFVARHTHAIHLPSSSSYIVGKVSATVY